jgi:hypothetical protein
VAGCRRRGRAGPRRVDGCPSSLRDRAHPGGDRWTCAEIHRVRLHARSASPAWRSESEWRWWRSIEPLPTHAHHDNSNCSQTVRGREHLHHLHPPPQHAQRDRLAAWRSPVDISTDLHHLHWRPRNPRKFDGGGNVPTDFRCRETAPAWPHEAACQIWQVRRSTRSPSQTGRMTQTPSPQVAIYGSFEDRPTRRRRFAS